MSDREPPISWQQILRQNFTCWEPLADFLQLSSTQREQILKKSDFSLNLPVRLAQKIAKGTLEDPILRQFLPTVTEKQSVLGFVKDPVGDTACQKTPKLLHKYEGRVLLVCTGACAMHCRFCFRQKYHYEIKDKTFENEIEIIASDESIHEVILSGGDPLSLPDYLLKRILDGLSTIPHVKRIRFHTRFPIGIPERIDDSFIDMLKEVKQQIWFIIHSNHPRELDDEVLSRLKSLHKLGVVLLCQTVLLRGVNADIKTLKEMCEKLSDNGILPYYLHQLDRVEGAAHFEVPEQEGLMLIKELSTQLSGYAVPRYVREDAGAPGKTILF